MAYQLRTTNLLDVHVGQLYVEGMDLDGTLIAPMVTTSNVLCENVYVQRAVECDNCGNIAGDLLVNGNITVTGTSTFNGNVVGDTTIVGNLIVTGSTNVNSPNTDALNSLTSVVNVSNSVAPSNTFILQASSSTSASWVNPSTITVGTATNATTATTATNATNFTGTSASGLNTFGYTTRIKGTGSPEQLTSSSTYYQRFEGGGNHIVKMPTSTQGQTFVFYNTGSGTLTVQSFNGTELNFYNSPNGYTMWMSPLNGDVGGTSYRIMFGS